jgi:hypothetical protein
MGTTWAQLGCSVLIMDLLGHGERRQHPFASVADYPGKFEVDRQDYSRSPRSSVPPGMRGVNWSASGHRWGSGMRPGRSVNWPVRPPKRASRRLAPNARLMSRVKVSHDCNAISRVS